MIKGMGWRRDLPDFRDYHPEHPDVVKLLPHLPNPVTGTPGPIAVVLSVAATSLSVDNRKWCSSIEDQQSIGSCTANAGVGLLEFFEKKAYGKYLDASRLFLYKTTRDLAGDVGDSGAELRTTMQALVMFGVPPESYWPYNIATFDKEPSAFLYSLGGNYKAVKYYRLDPAGTLPQTTLTNIKNLLIAGGAAMFGFTCYDSLDHVGADGNIPFPGPKEKVIGGHAIMVVGADDNHVIGTGATATKGALFIRNSWGTTWGYQGGYGWLPYQYILKGLAADFWTLTSAGWVDAGLFS